MKYIFMSEKERKTNYWRGFLACLVFIVSPLVIAFTIFCHNLIKLYE